MRIDRLLLPLSGGRLSMGFGQQVGLLETIGAKSGERRRIPLLYLRDGNHVILIASKGGNLKHPAWYHNLKANPRVEIEYGTERFAADVTEVSGPERDRLYAEQVAVQPGFADYEKKTDRVIPVFAVNRV
jgi:deazaflavin-dependent oxidoreductase (nitroreductase family)